MIGVLRALGAAVAQSGRTAPALPQMVLLPGGEQLPLRASIHPRARRMSIRLCSATRAVRLTLPPGTGHRRAMAFLDEHRGWIARQVAERLPPAIPFRPGVVLPVAGTELQLASGSGRHVRREADLLLVPGDGDLYAGRVKRWLTAEALALLEPETRALAATIGHDVRRVQVGEFRSRWGSCSSDGRIAYSWRLLLAPPHVREAVVAHEVAHLSDHDHSPRFWQTATMLLGRPHDEARAWLRAHGPQLMRYGARA